jgi:hypothetical protein
LENGGDMTETQVDEYIEKTKEITAKIIMSKKEAREFLAKTGMYTKKGELKKEFREGT